jgi:spore maturation protein A
MNKIFIGIISFSLIYGLLTGRFPEMANCILAIPEDVLSLVCTLVFSATFWSGIMMIMYDSGLINQIAIALNPLLNLIMPNLKDKEAKQYIAMNIAANIFELGFAATPAGLKAMRRLKEVSLEKEEGMASDEMVTFLVLNTAGVTLLPTTVMAIRQKYGAVNPSDFLLLTFVGTLLSCIGGLLLDYLFRKIKK